MEEGIESEKEANSQFRQLNSAISTKKTCFHTSYSDLHHLLSIVTTLYILFFLYFPPLIFFKIVFSPVIIITSTLLITILRYGAENGRNRTEAAESHFSSDYKEDHVRVTCPDLFSGDSFSSRNVEAPSEVGNEEKKYEKEGSKQTEAEDFEYFLQNEDNQDRVNCKSTGFYPDPFFEDSFVEWNVRAPLEVIYEAYGEGEDQENEDNHDQDPMKDPGKNQSQSVIERHPSLSFYYPDSDSDSNSSDGDFMAIGDWGSPEKVSLRWEDEDREEMIEISLDDRDNKISNEKKKRNHLELSMENFHGEEENNLIEIDISPVKNDQKWRFSSEDY